MTAAHELLRYSWVLALALTAAAAGVIARETLTAWRHRRRAAGARLITIAPPPEVEPAGAAALWANLAGTLTPSRWRWIRYGTPHLVFQYNWSGRRMLLSVWVPGDVANGAVEAAILHHVANASLMRIQARE